MIAPPPHQRIPKYRLNKTTGRALVEIDGITHWLGRHGTPESVQKYNRLVGEWLASGGNPAVPASELTVVELIARFWSHAEAFYGGNGGRGIEADNYRLALRPLKAMYGDTPAARFGPTALAAVRQRMIDEGWSRTHINRQVGRLKHVFK